MSDSIELGKSAVEELIVLQQELDKLEKYAYWGREAKFRFTVDAAGKMRPEAVVKIDPCCTVIFRAYPRPKGEQSYCEMRFEFAFEVRGDFSFEKLREKFIEAAPKLAWEEIRWKVG